MLGRPVFPVVPTERRDIVELSLAFGFRPVVTAEKCAKNYDVRVSVDVDDDDLRSRIINTSMDVIRKLMSHVPVVMVTLGDKGLLVRAPTKPTGSRETVYNVV